MGLNLPQKAMFIPTILVNPLIPYPEPLPERSRWGVEGHPGSKKKAAITVVMVGRFSSDFFVFYMCKK